MIFCTFEAQAGLEIEVVDFSRGGALNMLGSFFLEAQGPKGSSSFLFDLFLTSQDYLKWIFSLFHV